MHLYLVCIARRSIALLCFCCAIGTSVAADRTNSRCVQTFRHGIAEHAVMRLCKTILQHVAMLPWQCNCPGQLLLHCCPTLTLLFNSAESTCAAAYHKDLMHLRMLTAEVLSMRTASDCCSVCKLQQSSQCHPEEVQTVQLQTASLQMLNPSSQQTWQISHP